MKHNTTFHAFFTSSGTYVFKICTEYFQVKLFTSNSLPLALIYNCAKTIHYIILNLVTIIPLTLYMWVIWTFFYFMSSHLLYTFHWIYKKYCIRGKYSFICVVRPFYSALQFVQFFPSQHYYPIFFFTILQIMESTFLILLFSFFLPKYTLRSSHFLYNVLIFVPNLSDS
jgi:hypothetical protein